MEHIKAPSGVSFLEVQHDSHCPAIQSWSFADCLCKPDAVMHRDIGRFTKSVAQNRAARRKAAREAAKAIRRAAGRAK